MIALDTNVLLRALVDDDAAPAQCVAARRLVSAAGSVSISTVVFLETIWTLSRSFGFSRRDVARVGKLLLEHPKYRVQSADLFAKALARYAGANIDFSDDVALEDAIGQGAELFTFDRKLARLAGVRVVPER